MRREYGGDLDAPLARNSKLLDDIEANLGPPPPVRFPCIATFEGGGELPPDLPRVLSDAIAQTNANYEHALALLRDGITIAREGEEMARTAAAQIAEDMLYSTLPPDFECAKRCGVRVATDGDVCRLCEALERNPITGDHSHACPRCYTAVPCELTCTIEPDLSTPEDLRGAHATCADCADGPRRVAVHEITRALEQLLLGDTVARDLGVKVRIKRCDVAPRYTADDAELLEATAKIEVLMTRRPTL